MFNNLDYSELNEILQDSIEMQDMKTYKRVKAEIEKRVAQYE